MQDFPDQTETRSARLWETALIVNGYRRVWPTVGTPFPGHLVLDCRRKVAKDEGVSLAGIERKCNLDRLESQYRVLLRTVPGMFSNSQERHGSQRLSSTG